MTNDKLYDMPFAKLYPLLIQKAERKGRPRQEVDTITSYTTEDLARFLECDLTYGDFFLQAPCMNPNRQLITGSICGVKLAEITDPLMQDIRYLDKLVDELVKGKPMEKILRI